MSIPQPADQYVYGDCTYYVATIFPTIAGNMGNATDWIGSAFAKGYTVLRTPKPNTIVVYGSGDGYSQYGHVAVVNSVNSDGTFNVSEMNYSGWNYIDRRVSTMKDVIGFIVPPGQPTPADAQPLTPGSKTPSTRTLSDTAENGCVYSVPAFFPGGSSICFDKVVALIEFTLGGTLLFGGLAVLVSFALKGTKVGNAAVQAAGALGGPARAVVAKQKTARDTQQREQRQQEKAAKQQASEAAQEPFRQHRVRMQRAQLRAARARARTAEGRSRGGVAASARSKAKAGRFADFTPDEIAYAQRQGGESLFSQS